METRELNVIIRAVTTGFEEAMEKATTATKTLGSHIEDAGKSIEGMGRTIMPASLAVGAGLGLATKSAENFNQQMLLIRTQAGASQEEVNNLTDAVLKLAPAVGESPQKLAQALFFIESAGFRGANALDVLKLSAEGAQVGQADLIATSKILTSMLNDHIQGAENATVAMGNLNAIVGAGKMTFDDLNAALSTGVVDIAAAAGVSLQSLGAAIADLTNKGVPAVDAAMHLRMMITLIETPAAKAADTLKAMGLSAEDAGTRTAAMAEITKASGVHFTQLAEDLKKPNGISVALQDLQEHLLNAGFSSEQASALIEKSLGGIKAGTTAVELARSLGDVNDRFKQIGDTAGDFGKSWAAQQEQAKFKMEQFKETLDVLMVDIGNTVVPMLENFAKKLEGVFTWFNNLSPAAKQLWIDLGLLVAVGGPLLIFTGKLIEAGGLIIGLFGKMSSVFGAVRGVGMAGGMLEATEAGGGLLAALGPLGMGIGVAGIAAFGAYELFKKLTQSAKEQTDQLANTSNALEHYGGTTSLTTEAEIRRKNAEDAVKVSTDAVHMAQDAKKSSDEDLKQRTQDVADAQNSVNDALKIYGANSPQYQKAVQDLTDKQKDLDSAAWDNFQADLKVTAADVDLTNKKNVLNGAISLQANLQDILNDKLNTGLKLVGSFGQTARDQIEGVNQLQGALDGVIQSSDKVTAHLQTAANTNANLQSSIYQTAHDPNLQRLLGISGGGLQGGGLPGHAGGGSVSAGKPIVVGEEGAEIFVPWGSGSIIPNNKMSGGTTNNITVHTGPVGSNVDVQNIGRLIADQIGRLNRQAANGAY